MMDKGSHLPLRISRLFKRAIKQEKLAHAYLLNWRNQSIKEEITLNIAKTILCNDIDINNADDELMPCGACESCKKFSANVHPDLIIVRPDGSFIKINQIREIINKFAYPPYFDKRVCIIYDCHRFNQEAANTILKTLEEPNSDNYFFLCTNSMDMLLPTIISRCQALNMPLFFDISEEDMQNLSLPPFFLPLIKYLGITSREELSALKETDFFNIRQQILEFIENKSNYSMLELLNLSDKISKSATMTILVLKMLLTINRDLLMICNGINNVLNCEVMTFINEKENKFIPEKILEHNIWLNNAFYLIDRNINKSLIIEKSLAFYCNSI